jgi:DHA1 family tetracycline resistance protein-like MFS transporter
MKRSVTPMIAILMIAFFESIGSGLIIPLLPTLVNRAVGQDNSLQSVFYGLVVASSLVMMFLFSAFFGRLSDRYGRRPVILSTLVGVILAYAAMSVAESLWILLLAQAMVGFCAASASVGRAYVAEITSPDKRAQAYAYIGGVGALGLIVGPVIGGHLGRVNLQFPFYIAAGLTLLTLIFAFFALSESLDPDDRRPFSWRAVMPFASISVLSKSPPLARGVVIASLIEAFALGVASENGALILFMQNSLNWEMSQVGLWLTLMGISTALGAAIMTPLVIRFLGEKRGWLIGTIATCMLFAMAGFIHNAWQMYSLIAGYALLAFVGPVALALVSRSVPGNQLGEIHGSFISLSSLIKAIAVVLGTWVYGYFSGPFAPMQLSGAVFFLGAALQIPAVAYGFATMRKARSELEDDPATVTPQVAVG